MSLYHDIVDMGERAEKMADTLLRQHQNHELHRIGVVMRDLSLTIAHSLTALSPENRKRIAELEQAA